MTPNVTTDERSTVYGSRILVDERGREHRYCAREEQMTVLTDAGRVGGQHVPTDALPSYIEAVDERDGIDTIHVTDADGWQAILEEIRAVVAERAEDTTTFVARPQQ
jgi:hypothetical protein